MNIYSDEELEAAPRVEEWGVYAELSSGVRAALAEAPTQQEAKRLAEAEAWMVGDTSDQVRESVSGSHWYRVSAVIAVGVVDSSHKDMGDGSVVYDSPRKGRWLQDL